VGVFGPLSGVTELVVSIWLLITGIVAIRQALDFSTGKAILTALLGWLSAIAVAVLIALAIGGMAAIFGGIASMFGG
jgi:predicted double-glycine peptidase